MKLLIMFTLSMSFCFSAFAQRGHVESQAKMLTQDLEEIINLKAHLLRVSDLREINRLTREALTIARGVSPTPPPRPRPQPRPNPRPQPPRRGYGFHLEANVGQDTFVFEAKNLDDFMHVCMKEPAMHRGIANKFSVSLMNHQRVSTASGFITYYSTAKDKCSVLQVLTAISGFRNSIHVSPVSRGGYVVYGFANQKPILAKGYSMAEVRSSCLDYIKGSSFLTNKLDFYVNDRTMRSKTINYSANHDDICRNIANLIY